MKYTPAIILSCLAATAVPQYLMAGVVTPISSTRVVSSLNRETLPQRQVTLTGPAIGLWQAQAQVANASGQPNFNPNASIVSVTSSQLSDFSSAGVLFSGYLFIDYNGAVFPQLGTSASNRCDTVFHVEGDSEFQFQASIVTNSIGQFANSIFLRDNAGGANLFSLSASGVTSGTLPTGDYTLSILITGGSSGSQIADVRSLIDATFTIPSPTTGLALLVPLVFASRRRRLIEDQA